MPQLLGIQLGPRVGGVAGMGRYAVVQRSVDRKLTAEVLLSTDPTDERDWLAHVQRWGQLKHPSIPRLLCLGRLADGRLAAVQQIRPGVPWSQLLADPDHQQWATFIGKERAGTVSGEERLLAHVDIVMRLCLALEHASTHGLAHGNLVTSNVVIGPLGDVQVVGWEHALAGGPKSRSSDLLALTTTLKLAGGGAGLARIAEWVSRDPTADALGLRRRLQTFIQQRDADRLSADANALMETLLAIREDDWELPASRRAGRLIELRVRTLFSMALRLNPELSQARDGLDAYHGWKTQRALTRGDLAEAETHLAAQSQPDPKLQAKVREAQARHRDTLKRAGDFDELLSDTERRQRYGRRAVVLAVLGAVLATGQLLVMLSGFATHLGYAAVMALSGLGLLAASRLSRLQRVLNADRSARLMRNFLLVATFFPATVWVLLDLGEVSFDKGLILTLYQSSIVLAAVAAIYLPVFASLVPVTLVFTAVAALVPATAVWLVAAVTVLACMWGAYLLLRGGASLAK